MAALVPDENGLVFLLIKQFLRDVAGYHPGPVTPSTADESPIDLEHIETLLCRLSTIMVKRDNGHLWSDLLFVSKNNY